MNTADYCAAVKRKLRLPSDYALAKRLGLTTQAISLLVNGHSIMSATTAAKIAELLELDPLRVIADAELERGSDGQLWRRIRDAAVVAVMAIGAASFAMWLPAGQATSLHNHFSPTGAGCPQFDSNTHCVRIARRRRLAWLLWQVAVLLLALAVPGCAASADGPYAGIRTLASRQAIASSARNSGRIGPVYQVDDTAAAPGFLAGYRRGAWALEAGAGELGHRSSHNVSDTFDIRQDIATRHAYAAGLYHVGRGPWSAHILAGVTRVSMQNFERGSNENGPDQVQRNSAIDVAPIVGLGIAYTRGRATLRLDALRVENVARSLWTNHSDVTAIAASLVYTFGGP